MHNIINAMLIESSTSDIEELKSMMNIISSYCGDIMKDDEDIKVNKRSGDKVYFESPLVQSIYDKIDFLREESKVILEEKKDDKKSEDKKDDKKLIAGKA